MNSTGKTVAYLSPAMPALSETFVYEELLALERCGVTVVPFSVRKPAKPVLAHQALAQRVAHLYAGGPLVVVLGGLLQLPRHGRRVGRALAYLASDIWECGPLRFSSWKLGYQFLAGSRLAVWLLQRGCAHLHVHFAHVPTQIAMYASALSGVPFTVTAHANDIFEDGILLQKKAARAKRMLTISEFNRHYLESLGIPSKQLAVVRCGVSFTPRRVSPKWAAGPVFKIASLGRMVEKKGFDVLIRAVALLRQRGVLVELSLAGDGPLLSNMKLLAMEQCGLEGVFFVGGLPHHEVAAWMQQHDAFVLACKQDSQGDMDGIPVVLMEAMSQQVPVVSTRLSGIPELIAHEQTGLLAEPGSAESLAQQIARLIESPDLRQRLVAQAQAHIVQEFGQATNIARLVEYFKDETKL
jgi:colanic acid/amylovoran biosynthesis glycosyltransferase